MSLNVLSRLTGAGEHRRLAGYHNQLAAINALAADLQDADYDHLQHRAATLARRAQSGERIDDLLVEVFATCRELSTRVLGLRHYDVQLLGAMALHDGAIAEMGTGEGKTLTATAAVILNALTGEGVHVVTVNDYLAERDSRQMRPLYEAFGLSCLAAPAGQSAAERRAAYQADVTYITNTEAGFDFLRDRTAAYREDRVQRARRYAIVDEVDNILIDEARTPLIIAGAPAAPGDSYHQVAALAAAMVPGRRPDLDRAAAKAWIADFDYEADEKLHTVALTELGVGKAERALGVAHLYRPEHGHLINQLNQALKAQALYRRDVHYTVIDDAVVLIDEHTGRLARGRRWQDGLHQAVEAKEGVTVHPENPTVASITYQNLFRGYSKLAGMTGTAMTDAVELYKTYKLAVVEIPTHRPSLRVDHPDQVYATKDAKWRAAARIIADRHSSGQPVLVGTASVEDSELLATMLEAEGVGCAVLNAKPQQAAQEAAVIAQAGRLGAVTIATNMAGRGVDIRLGGDPAQLAAQDVARSGLTPDDDLYEHALVSAIGFPVEDPASVPVDRLGWDARCAAEAQQVIDLGGLFVLGCERHESRRIDHQLRGRAGRQGDPGETLFVLSAEDDLLRLFAGERLVKLMSRLGDMTGDHDAPLESKLLAKRVSAAQQAIEQRHHLDRKKVLDYDDVLAKQRGIVYALRDRVLEGDELHSLARSRVCDVACDTFEDALLDDDGFADAHHALAAVHANVSASIVPDRDRLADGDEQALLALRAATAAAYDAVLSGLDDDPTVLVDVQRQVLLGVLDAHWSEHLADMEYLQQGIHLRGFAQIEPLVAYRHEAYELFSAMIDDVWRVYAQTIFTARRGDDSHAAAA